MKKLIGVFGILAAFALVFLSNAAQVTIYNVSWQARWPWNGLVDITYYVDCENPDAQVLVLLSGHDNDRDVNVPITALLGPGITEPVKAGGPYTVTWYVAEDEPDLNSSSFTITMGGMIQNYADIVMDTYEVTCVGCAADVAKAAKGDEVTVTAVLPEGMDEAEAVVAWSFSPEVEFTQDGLRATFTMPAEAVEATATVTAMPKAYLVIDLSGGTETESFPYRFTNNAPDLSDDKCRTTELWLRRIPKGTFTMGSPTSEMGRENEEIQHEVTLTHDYYLGVFECTQKQYELVTGNKPSNYAGDTRPVEKVSYSMIRGTSSQAGAGWPVYGHTVDGASFIGILQAKTGLVFDLPTEAQWEYACRAGTTTTLNSGKNLNSAVQDDNMDEVGRYYYNQSDCKGGFTAQHTKVGSYIPNAWGLYDMHGNVREWCLDEYGAYPTSAVSDPVGPLPAGYRILRGGGWDNSAGGCRSAYRSNLSSSSTRNETGFRCMAHIPGEEGAYAITLSGAYTEFPEAVAGDVVVLTAVLPAGISASEAIVTWQFSPTVAFTQDGLSAVFTMPGEPVNVTATVVARTYPVTCTGCAANATEAAKGTPVTVTVNLPQGMPESEAVVTWQFSPSLAFSQNGTSASFTMPGSPIEVKATIAQKTYAVTCFGCVSNLQEAPADQIVMVTAELPDGLAAADVEGVTWYFSPAQQYSTNNLSASFQMPSEPVVVMATVAAKSRDYLVVDLSGGTSAETFPYHYSADPPNLADDTCRTTELWLRRIPAGGFTMGSPTSEMGRKDDEVSHRVTLTQDYYIGVFECTQKQYELVTGKKPSVNRGNTRPVEYVSYDMIRGTSSYAGAGWPTHGHTVDGDSFMGILQAKTGLIFDLPTEAEWEYACRAGTSTALNSGKDLNSVAQDANMDVVGRYDYNKSDGKGGYTSYHTKVGSYLPNTWGLYDMHGNVREWCLDEYGAYPTSAVSNPGGPAPSGWRILRGGGWDDGAAGCRSANRNNVTSSSTRSQNGFRCTARLAGEVEKYAITISGATAAVSEAMAGAVVRMTAILPSGLPESEAVVTWRFSSSVNFTQSGLSAFFTMPGKPLEVTATVAARTYELTCVGGEANVPNAPKGELVMVYPTLPEGIQASDAEVTWHFSPEVEFRQEGFSAYFTMPGQAVKATATVMAKSKSYLVVDLSGGTAAQRFPYRYSKTGPDLSNDTCRTTELWLRHIPAGTFVMGAPMNELGRRSYEDQHQVTLTQDFYVGVFECTQKQYELVMGSNPSYKVGTTNPVDCVTYDMIRGMGSKPGAGWPVIGHMVDQASFMGVLQAKTGLTFDLPTEAEWEYACRADTTTALNSGKNLTSTGQDANMNEVGRYLFNSSNSFHTKVGCYLPNAWGLYDMHGNVSEWCLDWFGEYPAMAVTDPRGAITGSNRVLRGGQSSNPASNCRSASRDADLSNSQMVNYGFRCTTRIPTNTYLVIDLSGGATAEHFPYRYSVDGPDLSNNTCRTTELWLRRIPSGIFHMGSPADEVGRKTYETLHEVSLTEDYYIGVFECTQMQYKLVTGDNPSELLGNERPVDRVSYEMIRGAQAGAGWPASGYAVDASSFMGILRAKTGLLLDLPTEAEWEYACRAGITTALNSGKNLTATGQDANMAAVGRYSYNCSDGKGSYSEHTKVGCYLPNAWGLYDMHGNVTEWCLDWQKEDMVDAAVTNPKGSPAGVARVLRGGNWNFDAQLCRSACRQNYLDPSLQSNKNGFRVAGRISPTGTGRYQITTSGANTVSPDAMPGEVVAVTAILPEWMEANGVAGVSWKFSPEVEFVQSGISAFFLMPDEPVSVTATVAPKPLTYLVIDLSGGTSAENFPYRFTDRPPNVSDDTCRTTELWLRHIPAGTFLMGVPKGELGGYIDDKQHTVTLTKDYFIGLFECTQRQFELVTGDRSSWFSNAAYYATRPVDAVTYGQLRGHTPVGFGWTTYGHTVEANSFFGILQAKTGLVLDLPTEAQWEYACRAGTTTALNSGENLSYEYECQEMSRVGRYKYNNGYYFPDPPQMSDSYDYDIVATNKGTAKVGSYQPNAWGLYDMHGNVYEWCVDKSVLDLGTAAVVDPVGPPCVSLQDAHVIRGGSWKSDARYCRSGERSGDINDGRPACTGFRVAFFLP